MEMIKNEYIYNSSFKHYVDEFCKSNNCTIDEAFNNEEVKKMFWRYTEV